MTQAEEDYLKAIFKIAEREKQSVSTNAIAALLNTTAASVTDMLKKLALKELVNYKKYHGVQLSDSGNKLAIQLIRKHRLWEVFLVDKLKFNWNEVHDMAEQLEHIKSTELIRRLDIFLGHPKFDPHGDPIPNAEGKFTIRNQVPLMDLSPSQNGVVIGVRNNNDKLLDYLTELEIKLGTHLKLVSVAKYDNSHTIIIDHQNQSTISKEVANKILLRKTNV